MPRTQNLDRIKAVLETDRNWSAFALADLSPEDSVHCEWHLANDDSSLMLVYRGFEPPLLFTLGNPALLLDELAGEPELYVSVPVGVPELLTAAGHRHDLKLMHRMVLNREVFQPGSSDSAERLGPSDHPQLAELFADGDSTGERPGFFKESSLTIGVYFGIRENGTLIAAAGTHMFAPEQSVGCLGNVYTRRDRRGRGLASIATAAVTAELLRQNIRTIVLNVTSNNTAAIRVYERLGFKRYCDYWEGKATASSSRELFAEAFAGDEEDDNAWRAVSILRRRNSAKVSQLAADFCKSSNPKERSRALDVLAQLGAGRPVEERPFLEESISIAARHLQDENLKVVHSAAWALSHLGFYSDQTISILIGLRTNSDAGVRLAVAYGMAGSTRVDATETLLLLMEDPDDEVRNWATFGLGEQPGADSQVIREALCRRLSDPFEDVRAEAIWGLARRKDPGGLELLLNRIEKDESCDGDVMAAAETLDLPADTPVDHLCQGLQRLLTT